jgi:4-diphosphocytidyl-2-C-methyl-D-erythritol kinase
MESAGGSSGRTLGGSRQGKRRNCLRSGPTAVLAGVEPVITCWPPPVSLTRTDMLTLPAPAKINLHLEILGRRADGFHGLETVFQTLALADEVTVALEPGTGITLTCSDPTIPVDERNLAWRAAAAIQAHRPGCGRVTMALEKRIPHGAGLGGGSSDAASVLLGLNHMLEAPLSAAELAAIALDLGSDVPFFLIGGTAHATGRGEVLTPLTPLPPLPVTVLMPAAQLPTPSVFKELTDAERGPRQARGAQWAAAQSVAALLQNRLTEPARRLCPAVVTLLDWLAGQGVPHLLSGSGAACFALAHVSPPAGVRAFHTSTAPGAPEYLPHRQRCTRVEG